jgi:hypothetical protein
VAAFFMAKTSTSDTVSTRSSSVQHSSLLVMVSPIPHSDCQI